VTDWCTESFPDAGAVTGDGAMFRLPANAGGYAVYARITGKPGGDGEPTVTFNQGEFTYVEDESGNDLILVGSFKDGATRSTARVRSRRRPARAFARRRTSPACFSGPVWCVQCRTT